MPYKDPEKGKEYHRSYQKSEKGRASHNRAVTKWTERNFEKKAAQTKAWAEANPKKIKFFQRKSLLKRKYGITFEQYEELASRQEGVCAICRKEESTLSNGLHGNEKHVRSLNVDHDHKTGKVRGLLCTKCNHMIGLADDNIAILRSAIIYLKK